MGGSSHSGSGSDSDEGETFMVVTGGGMKKEGALAGFLAFKEQEEALLKEEASNSTAATESAFPCQLEDLLFCSSGKEDEIVIIKYDRRVLAQRLVDELNLSNEHFFEASSSAALSKETVKFLFEKYHTFPLLPLTRLLLWQKNKDLVMETYSAVIASELTRLREEGLAEKLWVKNLISTAESGHGIGSKLLALSSTLLSEVFTKDLEGAGRGRSFTADNIRMFCRLCREEGITTLADLVSLDLLLGKKAFKHLLNRFHAKEASSSPDTPNLSFAIIADWIKASVLSKISIQTPDKKSKKENKSSKPASSGVGSSILPMVETSSSSINNTTLHSTQSSKVENSSPKSSVLSKLFESMRVTPPPPAASSSSMGRTINKSIPIQIHPSDSNKIIVNFGGSSAVMVDRWCPHKKADMAKGSVVGGKLICPKHKWAFDLQNGGRCLEKSACINVCPIPDW